MQSKNAIGNLINRYRAVLKKCHLMNTFGSLAVAGMLVMGSAGVASATIFLNGNSQSSGSVEITNSWGSIEANGDHTSNTVRADDNDDDYSTDYMYVGTVTISNNNSVATSLTLLGDTHNHTHNQSQLNEYTSTSYDYLEVTDTINFGGSGDKTLNFGSYSQTDNGGVAVNVGGGGTATINANDKYVKINTITFTDGNSKFNVSGSNDSLHNVGTVTVSDGVEATLVSDDINTVTNANVRDDGKLNFTDSDNLTIAGTTLHTGASLITDGVSIKSDSEHTLTVNNATGKDITNGFADSTRTTLRANGQKVLVSNSVNDGHIGSYTIDSGDSENNKIHAFLTVNNSNNSHTALGGTLLIEENHGLTFDSNQGEVEFDTITAKDGTTLNVDSGKLDASAATFGNNATLKIRNGASGTITTGANSGFDFVEASFYTSDAVYANEFKTKGTVTLANGVSVLANQGSGKKTTIDGILNVGDGKEENPTGASLTTSNTDFLADATLNVNADASFTNESSMTFTDGAIINIAKDADEAHLGNLVLDSASDDVVINNDFASTGIGSITANTVGNQLTFNGAGTTSVAGNVDFDAGTLNITNGLVKVTGSVFDFDDANLNITGADYVAEVPGSGGNPAIPTVKAKIPSLSIENAATLTDSTTMINKGSASFHDGLTVEGGGFTVMGFTHTSATSTQTSSLRVTNGKTTTITDANTVFDGANVNLTGNLGVEGGSFTVNNADLKVGATSTPKVTSFTGVDVDIKAGTEADLFGTLTVDGDNAVNVADDAFTVTGARAALTVSEGVTNFGVTDGLTVDITDKATATFNDNLTVGKTGVDDNIFNVNKATLNVGATGATKATEFVGVDVDIEAGAEANLFGTLTVDGNNATAALDDAFTVTGANSALTVSEGVTNFGVTDGLTVNITNTATATFNDDLTVGATGVDDNIFNVNNATLNVGATGATKATKFTGVNVDIEAGAKANLFGTLTVDGNNATAALDDAFTVTGAGTALTVSKGVTNFGVTDGLTVSIADTATATFNDNLTVGATNVDDNIFNVNNATLNVGATGATQATKFTGVNVDIEAGAKANLFGTLTVDGDDAANVADDAFTVTGANSALTVSEGVTKFGVTDGLTVSIASTATATFNDDLTVGATNVDDNIFKVNNATLNVAADKRTSYTEVDVTYENGADVDLGGVLIVAGKAGDIDEYTFTVDDSTLDVADYASFTDVTLNIENDSEVVFASDGTTATLDGNGDALVLDDVAMKITDGSTVTVGANDATLKYDIKTTDGSITIGTLNDINDDSSFVVWGASDMTDTDLTVHTGATFEVKKVTDSNTGTTGTHKVSDLDVYGETIIGENFTVTEDASGDATLLVSGTNGKLTVTENTTFNIADTSIEAGGSVDLKGTLEAQGGKLVVTDASGGKYSTLTVAETTTLGTTTAIGVDFLDNADVDLKGNLTVGGGIITGNLFTVDGNGTNLTVGVTDDGNGSPIYAATDFNDTLVNITDQATVNLVGSLNIDDNVFNVKDNNTSLTVEGATNIGTVTGTTVNVTGNATATFNDDLIVGVTGKTGNIFNVNNATLNVGKTNAAKATKFVGVDVDIEAGAEANLFGTLTVDGDNAATVAGDAFTVTGANSALTVSEGVTKFGVTDGLTVSIASTATATFNDDLTVGATGVDENIFNVNNATLNVAADKDTIFNDVEVNITAGADVDFNGTLTVTDNAFIATGSSLTVADAQDTTYTGVDVTIDGDTNADFGGALVVTGDNANPTSDVFTVTGNNTDVTVDEYASFTDVKLVVADGAEVTFAADAKVDELTEEGGKKYGLVLKNATVEVKDSSTVSVGSVGSGHNLYTEGGSITIGSTDGLLNGASGTIDDSKFIVDGEADMNNTAVTVYENAEFLVKKSASRKDHQTDSLVTSGIAKFETNLIIANNGTAASDTATLTVNGKGAVLDVDGTTQLINATAIFNNGADVDLASTLTATNGTFTVTGDNSLLVSHVDQTQVDVAGNATMSHTTASITDHALVNFGADFAFTGDNVASTPDLTISDSTVTVDGNTSLTSADTKIDTGAKVTLGNDNTADTFTTMFGTLTITGDDTILVSDASQTKVDVKSNTTMIGTTASITEHAEVNFDGDFGFVGDSIASTTDLTISDSTVTVDGDTLLMSADAKIDTGAKVTLGNDNTADTFGTTDGTFTVIGDDSLLVSDTGQTKVDVIGDATMLGTTASITDHALVNFDVGFNFMGKDKNNLATLTINDATVTVNDVAILIDANTDIVNGATVTAGLLNAGGGTFDVTGTGVDGETSLTVASDAFFGINALDNSLAPTKTNITNGAEVNITGILGFVGDSTTGTADLTINDSTVNAGSTIVADAEIKIANNADVNVTNHAQFEGGSIDVTNNSDLTIKGDTMTNINGKDYALVLDDVDTTISGNSNIIVGDEANPGDLDHNLYTKDGSITIGTGVVDPVTGLPTDKSSFIVYGSANMQNTKLIVEDGSEFEVKVTGGSDGGFSTGDLHVKGDMEVGVLDVDQVTTAEKATVLVENGATLTATNTTVSSKVDNAEMTVTGNSTVDLLDTEITDTVIKVIDSVMTVESLTLGNTTLFSDPSYTQADTHIEGVGNNKIYIGSGSVHQVGAGNVFTAGVATDLGTALTDAGNNVTAIGAGATVALDEAALVITGGKNIALKSNSVLYIDDEVRIDGFATSGLPNNVKADGANLSVYIGAGSTYVADVAGRTDTLLSVDGSNANINLNKNVSVVDLGAKIAVVSDGVSTGNVTLLDNIGTNEKLIYNHDADTIEHFDRMQEFTSAPGTGNTTIFTNGITGKNFGVDNALFDSMQGMWTNKDNSVYHSTGAVSFFSRIASKGFVGSDAEAARLAQSYVNVNAAAGIAGVSFDASKMASTAINQRLDNPYSAGQSQVVAQNASSNLVASTEAFAPATENARGIGVWGGPIYQQSDVDGMKAGTIDGGYDSHLAGGIFGVDVTKDAFRLGAAINMGTGEADSQGDFADTSNDVDFWGASLYAGYYLGNLGLKADAGYTALENSFGQKADFVGLASSSADVDAEVYTAGLTADYTFNLGKLNIIPHIGVRYSSLSQDSFTTSHGLHVDSADMDSITLPVGITFEGNFESGDWTIAPSLDLSYIAAFGDTEIDNDVSIANVASFGTAHMDAEVLDESTFAGSLGLDLSNGDWTIGIDYTGEISDNRESHSFFGTIRYDF